MLGFVVMYVDILKLTALDQSIYKEAIYIIYICHKKWAISKSIIHTFSVC